MLWSKVERMFAEKGWKIIWTPPYAPKFQPIELVWGVGKQRAGCMYFKGRDLATTRAHLRIGWHGGSGRGRTFEKCNVGGCWERRSGRCRRGSIRTCNTRPSGVSVVC